ncbi:MULTISPECIES: chemotaxis protein CheW [Pseudomonas]|uniref:Purine-binding chemotaxis protein CheW n=1 Tax=Pseudomonas gingeri TaxID=117681 RepID=A0A7Y8BR18_9PSED|nr:MULTISPECIES: chemotaxis protein CheW [Pseudomonas]NWB85215.1 purine-binding chemotaxis protein CheW [Pseudomonas gingeri]
MSESISPLRQPQDAVPTQYLTFSLGQEMFAVGTLSVREIVEYGPITALPLAPPSIRGVTNLRGAAIPVLDLGLRFGGGLTQQSARTCIVMLETRGADGSGLVGIIVDAVSEVLEIARDQIEPAPALNGRLSPAFILGIGKLNGGFVLLLDIEQILGADDWSALQSQSALTQGLAS